MKKIKRLFIIGITYSFIFLTSAAVNAVVNIQEWDTPEKIHVIFVSDNSTDLISVNFSFKGTGSKTDSENMRGLTKLMTQLLMERKVENTDHFTLQKKLKKLGVLHGIQFSVDRDNINFFFKCPKTTIKEVLEIIAIFITAPEFDTKELAKMKNYDPSGARLATSTERDFAGRILLQKLFGDYPYAFPPSGTLEGIQPITVNDLKIAARKRFSRNVLVFSVIGKIQPQILTQYIDNSFKTLPFEAELPTLSSNPPLNANGKIITIPKDSPQCGVVFGQNGVPMNDKDFLPFLIINNVLGGKPFTSRLWQEAREKRGLVYFIQTDLLAWQSANLLMGSFESSNAAATEVINLIRKEWGEIFNQGIREEEFKAIKAGLKGSFVLNFTAPEGISQFLLNCYLLGIPLNYINERNKQLDAVTLEDVKRVAKTRLDPEKLTFIIVGNEK